MRYIHLSGKEKVRPKSNLSNRDYAMTRPASSNPGQKFIQYPRPFFFLGIERDRKRSQQLLQLAKIEEIQEFDTDIGHVREFRNENEIRMALERVSGIQDRLKEIFFWFEDHSIESKRLISLISKANYKAAIDIFEKSDKSNADWLGSKNLSLSIDVPCFRIFQSR